jgi:xylulokinase
MTGSYYLGLDLSTQQLKCTVINEKHEIVLEEAVNFDKDLPEFNTVHGAIVNDNVATAPTLMWVKALDILLTRLKGSSYIGSIAGISGAGQVRIYMCVCE